MTLRMEDEDGIRLDSSKGITLEAAGKIHINGRKSMFCAPMKILRAEDMKTVRYDKSWLACKYMGRIMSADMVPEIDTNCMTEEEAFEWMLKWAKGEYIPQVLLDKITHIYAGGDEVVENFRKDFPYSDAKADPEDPNDIKGKKKAAENRVKYAEFSFELYDNINTFDSKFLAWSKFANKLWEGEQKDIHLNISPEILKAISMVESSMGDNDGYNGTINIMKFITIGDGTLWQLANYNPTSKLFHADEKKNVLVWRAVPHEGKEMVDNGYVQFPADDYFYEKSEDVTDSRFEKVKLRKRFFGKADMGDRGNPILEEAIKTVATNSSQILEGDTESSMPEEEKNREYTLKVEYKLACLGTQFVD